MTPSISVTPSLSTSPEPTTYSIEWSFSQGADSGDFSISVNGTEVVYRTSNDSGTLIIAIGASVNTGVSAGAQSPLTAQADLTVIDNGTTLYNHFEQGYPVAADFYGPYTPSGNGSIVAAAYEF